MPYPIYQNYGNYAYPQNYSYAPQVTPVVAPQIPQPQQQQNNGVQWVQGEAAAKSYLVGANQSVLLMDSEANTFYIKSADASGMPMPLRIFDYTERTQPVAESTAVEVDLTGYVTKEDLQKTQEELKKLIDSLKTSIAKEGGTTNAKKSSV